MMMMMMIIVKVFAEFGESANDINRWQYIVLTTIMQTSGVDAARLAANTN